MDELTQRLALASGGVWNNRGKPFAPRVVRLGKPSEEAADRVKAVSLEVMVEERSGNRVAEHGGLWFVGSCCRKLYGLLRAGRLGSLLGDAWIFFGKKNQQHARSTFSLFVK